MSQATGVSPDVLLVEDSADDEELTLRALRGSGVARVVVARDGEEALERLLGMAFDVAPQTADPLPRLVLLDLKLPKIDGLGVLERLRAHAETRALPVVVLTTSAEEADVAACYARGANSYVVKPVDYKAFALTLRALSSYWLGLNETPRGAAPQPGAAKTPSPILQAEARR